MIELTIKGETLEEIRDQLRSVLADADLPAAEPAPAAKPKAKAKKAKAEPVEPQAPAGETEMGVVKEEPKAEVVEAEVVAEPEPQAEPKEEITIDTLRRHLAPLGPQKGKALLAKFGATKLSEVDPGKYADLLSEAQAA